MSYVSKKISGLINNKLPLDKLEFTTLLRWESRTNLSWLGVKLLPYQLPKVLKSGVLMPTKGKEKVLLMQMKKLESLFIASHASFAYYYY